MAINTKDRGTLKTYFSKNKIPTESNFADLINGTLNLADDGIFKLANDPLSLVAAGEASSPLKLLNFYLGASDANPAWTFLLRPREKLDTPETARSGFGLSDGPGNCRLFVEAGSGNVGVGTVQPDRKLTVANSTGANYLNVKDGTHEILLGVDGNGGIISTMSNHDLILRAGANSEKMRLTAGGAVGIGTAAPLGKLDVGNLVRLGLDEGNSGARSISFARDAGDEVNSGKITYRGAFGAGAMHLVGAGVPNTPRRIRLWDNVEINGALIPSAGNSDTSGIAFPLNPGGGGYDAATIRYFVRSGEACTLELRVENDADDHIALMPSGCVGIGTHYPTAKLHVAGSIGGGQTSTGWVLGGGSWGPDNWLRLTTSQNGSVYHDLAVNHFWSAGSTRFDLAEVTPVNQDDRLEHGDVVVIDPEDGLRVRRSRQAGDCCVYGVMSSYEQAAFVIGGMGPELARDNPAHLPVALVGRVAVKASAENGPIRAGDLLTTAATPGHAMRCDDRARYAGAIIGKALQALPAGSGMIKMLVALQ